MKFWQHFALLLTLGLLLLAAACRSSTTTTPAGKRGYSNPVLPGFHPLEIGPAPNKNPGE